MKADRRIEHAMTALVALLLGACASSPQILPVIPEVDPQGVQPRGDGRSIAVEVVDARDTDVVGYRDPNDKSSAITGAPEMLDNIRHAVEDGYRKLGFEVVPVAEEADIALEVRLAELAYRRAEGGVVRELKTGATVEATSVMDGKTVDAVYRDAQGKDTVLPPSLRENADILNHHLSAALTKLVADPRLTTP